MLPNGKLSLHGYTKTWGFFNGTCFGARELPFEQSKALVDDAIRRAQVSARSLRDQALTRESMKTPLDIYRQVYVHWGRRWGVYDIYHGSIEERGTEFYFVFKDERGQPREDRIHDSGKLAYIIAKHNLEQAERLRRDAEGAERYIKWQQSRIKDWQVKPLKPR